MTLGFLFTFYFICLCFILFVFYSVYKILICLMFFLFDFVIGCFFLFIIFFSNNNVSFLVFIGNQHIELATSVRSLSGLL